MTKLLHEDAGRDARHALPHHGRLDRAVAGDHRARTARLAGIGAQLLNHRVGRYARGRELDAHARLRQIGPIGRNVAGAVEHDDRFVAATGERRDVGDQRRARAVVHIVRIGVIRLVEDKLLVARRRMDDVVAVHDQKLALPAHVRPARHVGRRESRGERVAHAVGARIDELLRRSLAEALRLGLGPVLLGHGLLARPVDEHGTVAAHPLEAEGRRRLGDIQALGLAALGELGQEVARLEHQAGDALAL